MPENLDLKLNITAINSASRALSDILAKMEQIKKNSVVAGKAITSKADTEALAKMRADKAGRAAEMARAGAVMASFNSTERWRKASEKLIPVYKKVSQAVSEAMEKLDLADPIRQEQEYNRLLSERNRILKTVANIHARAKEETERDAKSAVAAEKKVGDAAKQAANNVSAANIRLGEIAFGTAKLTEQAEKQVAAERKRAYSEAIGYLREYRYKLMDTSMVLRNVGFAAGAAGASILAMVIAPTKAGIQFNDTLATSQNIIESLIKSTHDLSMGGNPATASRALLGKIMNLSIVSPIETGAMVGMAKRYYTGSRGAIKAAQVPAEFSLIGDAAMAVSGGNVGEYTLRFKQLADIIAQTRAQGFANGRTMNRLRSLGLPAPAYLQEAYGYSPEGAAEQLRKPGGMDSSRFLDAIFKGITKDFAGATERYVSKSATAAFDAVKDSLTMLSADMNRFTNLVLGKLAMATMRVVMAFDSIPEPIKNFAAALTTVATALGIGAGVAGIGIGGGAFALSGASIMAAGLPEALSAATAFTPYLGRFGTLAKGVMGSRGFAKAASGNVLNYFRERAAGKVQNEEVLPGLLRVLFGTPGVEAASGAFGATTAGATLSVTNRILSKMLALSVSSFKYGTMAIVGALRFIKSFLLQVVGDFRTIGGFLKRAFGASFKGVSESAAGNAIGSFLGGVATRYGGKILDAGRRLLPLLLRFGRFLVRFASWTLVVDLIAGAINRIVDTGWRGALSAVGGAISRAARSVGGSIVRVLRSVLEMFAGEIIRLLGRIPALGILRRWFPAEFQEDHPQDASGSDQSSRRRARNVWTPTGARYGSGGYGGAAGTGRYFGGFRASGGPVSKRKWYVVGEHGPEIFAPKQDGSILSRIKNLFHGIASSENNLISSIAGPAGAAAVTSGRAAGLSMTGQPVTGMFNYQYPSISVIQAWQTKNAMAALRRGAGMTSSFRSSAPYIVVPSVIGAHGATSGASMTGSPFNPLIPPVGRGSRDYSRSWMTLYPTYDRYGYDGAEMTRSRGRGGEITASRGGGDLVVKIVIPGYGGRKREVTRIMAENIADATWSI